MSTPVKPDWKLHHYYWDGQCKPGGEHSFGNSFSVGIFRTEQGRKGLKRGPVQIRIRGYKDQAEEVYWLAQKACNELNETSATALRYKLPKDFPKLIDVRR